jgi:hypothetical protein
VPKVVLSLWDGGQQIRPFSFQPKLWALVVLEIADGIPSSLISIQPYRQITSGALDVGRLRKLKFLPIAISNYQDPLAELGNSVIGSIQLGNRDPIICVTLAIDFLDLTPDQLQPFALLPISKPRYVLQQESLRERIAKHPKIGGHGARTRVIQAKRVSRCPIPSL